MSLQVWLPLNGDLTNQGLSDITVTNNGATIDSSGKIGQCYSFDGTNDNIIASYPSYSTDISFCCWVYFKSLASEIHLMDYRNSSGTGYQPMDITSTRIQIGSQGKFSNFSYSFSTNTWYHICVTENSSMGIVYINGEKIGSSSTSVGYNYNSILPVYIGSRYNSTNWLNGKVNDVRIYDHCLSPKEVKEISKGLVLHYKLCGEGNPNLFDRYSFVNLYNNTSTNKKIYIDLNSNGIINGQEGYQQNICHWGENNEITFLSNTQYTWSFDIETLSLSNIKASHGYNIVYTDNSSTSYTFYLTSVGYKQKIILTSEAGKTVKYISPGGWSYDGTLCLTNIKFEIGSSSTPWCPNSQDSLYSAFGYNNNIEYDCSGYGYNGIKNDSISCVNDAPRYLTSYIFNGSNYITVSTYPKIIDALTVSWWGYMSSWSSYARACSCTEGGGWNFEPGSSCMSVPVYQTGVGYIHVYDITTLASLTSGWHHWAMTFDSKNLKLYRDGLLINTYISSTTAGISYANTPLMVGCESPSGSNFKGNMSDFRIYATALSDKDILELYQSSNIIDNNGNNYSYEYIER